MNSLLERLEKLTYLLSGIGLSDACKEVQLAAIRIAELEREVKQLKNESEEVSDDKGL